MTPALMNGLRVAVVLVLAALAHGPLLGGGLRAPDVALLERAHAAELPRLKEIARVDPHGSPLAGLTQGAVARAWPVRSVDGRSAAGPGAAGESRRALPLRALSLALVLAAAAGLAVFARRLVLPWTGPEHATATAWAVAPLAAVHPAMTALIADPAALDELLALTAGTWSAALFLRGRQDRAFGWTAGALWLAVVAGFAGELALLLPLALAFAELVSSHRYRRRHERMRTALNTLLFFGAAVTPGLAMWFDKGGVSRFAAAFTRLGADPLAAFSELAERVSTVALPANPALFGAVGVLLAGAAIVLTLQPAMVAARSAPRLWSRMLGWWLLLVGVAALYGLGVPVTAAQPTHQSLLALAAFALVLGPAVAGTALGGFRRALLPFLLAGVWAGLAGAGAWSWRAAADVSRDLERDLAAARELYGSDARMLVLDTLDAVDGIETLGDDVAALVPGQSDVETLSTAAFRMLAYQPEFAQQRAERLVVLAGRELLPADAGTLRPDGARQALQLGPPSVTGGTRTWRGIGAWTPDVDTLSSESLVVRADLLTDVSAERRVHWRVSEPAVALGSMPCVWIETGDEPVLVAHLGASLPWILGDRARRVWFEGGVLAVAEARLDARPPAFEPVTPTTDGADWLFPRVTTSLTEASLQRGRYVLTLLSLKDKRFRELPVERFGEDLLKAAGAARAVAEMPRPVAWSLEFRVEGVPLARASGRRVGRDGTVEQDR